MNNNYYYRIALQQWIYDPKNAHYNFYLGRFYEDNGHTASAISYYLRTTEYGSDKTLTYEALLRTALCFRKQGCRTFMVKGVLLRAIALLPQRPEAYFLLSRTYEQAKDWQESYVFANLGLELKEEEHIALQTDVEYPGRYGFTFEKAVVAWWIGLYDESLGLFRELNKVLGTLLPVYKQAVQNNLNTLNNYNPFIQYDDTLYERLRVKFNGAKKIKKNFSQSYQDMFVLTMLNGKRYGKYVEIGCATAYYGNNTTLLAQEFGWDGVSIDIDQNCVNAFNKDRECKAICADATKIDYTKLLKETTYDYLQVDCDPAITTMEILLKIPFESHKFAVITLEHDHYISPDSGIRDRSRRYLETFGYKLCVGDIGCNRYNSYEDWWVLPELMDKNILEKMISVDDEVKRGDDYMLIKI